MNRTIERVLKGTVLAFASLALGVTTGCAADNGDAGDEEIGGTEDALSSGYRSMLHTCGLTGIGWLADGRIAVGQTDCPQQAASDESNRPLTLWKPNGRSCESWNLGCAREESATGARFEVGADGKAFLAFQPNSWSVTSKLSNFSRAGATTWFPSPYDGTRTSSGGPARLPIYDGALSSDAAYVALWNSQGDIFVTNVATTKTRRAMSGTSSAATLSTNTTTSWASGPRRVVFTALTTKTNAQFAASKIAIADVGPDDRDGPTLRTIAAKEELLGQATNPIYLGAALAPNGEHVLVGMGRQVPILEFGRTKGYTTEGLPLELRDLQLGVVRTYPKSAPRLGNSQPTIAFSANGGHFLVTGSFADGFNGTRAFAIDKADPIWERAGAWTAALSPDGTQIAYGTTETTQNRRLRYRVAVVTLP